MPSEATRSCCLLSGRCATVCLSCPAPPSPCSPPTPLSCLSGPGREPRGGLGEVVTSEAPEAGQHLERSRRVTCPLLRSGLGRCRRSPACPGSVAAPLTGAVLPSCTQFPFLPPVLDLPPCLRQAAERSLKRALLSHLASTSLLAAATVGCFFPQTSESSPDLFS